MLPKTPEMLLSIVNLKLRDNYDSLSSLCDDMDESEEEINAILTSIGYHYDKATNQFKAD